MNIGSNGKWKLTCKHNHATAPAFERAVVGGHVWTVARALEQTPQLANGRTRSGETMVHLAIVFNQPVVLGMLIEHGADINYAGPSLSSIPPLMAAVVAGRAACLELLLANPALDPVCRCGTGRTPLIVAVINDQPQTLSLLLGCAAIDPNEQSDHLQSPLSTSILRNHLACFHALMDNASPSGQVRVDDLTGQVHQTALHAAASNDRHHMAARLLLEGADASVLDVDRVVAHNLTTHPELAHLLRQALTVPTFQLLPLLDHARTRDVVRCAHANRLPHRAVVPKMVPARFAPIVRFVLRGCTPRTFAAAPLSAQETMAALLHIHCRLAGSDVLPVMPVEMYLAIMALV
jgi:hypothetical protein